MAIGSASTMLMIRTIAIWNRAPLVTAPLVIASLGQWGVLLRGSTTVRSSWSDTLGACVISNVLPRATEWTYLYTMSFDLVVLVLTTIGLVRSPGRSSLWQLLFRQGVIYFLIAFVANTVTVVFLLLNLNVIMSAIFSFPASTASSIAACRSFVSLTNFRPKGVYAHAAVIQPPTRLHASGSSGGSDATQICASDNSLEKINRSARIAFRSKGACVDSVGQGYSLDQLESRTTDTPSTTNSKGVQDLGGANEDSGVVVHVDITTHEDSVV